MDLTSFSLCYSFYSAVVVVVPTSSPWVSPPMKSVFCAFATKAEGKIANCWDTGTLLWTHVVLTINENSSRSWRWARQWRKKEKLENLSISRKNSFFACSSLEYSTKKKRTGRDRSGQHEEDEMKCICAAIAVVFLLYFVASFPLAKPLYNYRNGEATKNETVFAFVEFVVISHFARNCFWDKVEEVIEVDVARKKPDNRTLSQRKTTREIREKKTVNLLNWKFYLAKLILFTAFIERH